tara:strand:- start:26 stop:355 length:330 start_codon:yes stop_codon:yes gene_type:complete
MTQNSAALAGKIDKFQIFKAKEGSNISVDMLGACVELKYYESVLSNTISASAIIVETGFTDRTNEDGDPIMGIVDTLPVRGGELSFWSLKMHNQNQINFLLRQMTLLFM